jgi:hypothetical protein
LQKVPIGDTYKIECRQNKGGFTVSGGLKLNGGMEVRQIDLLKDRLDRDEVPIFYQKLKDPPVVLETGDKEGYPGEYVGEDGNDYYPFIEGNKAWVESNGSVTCDTSYNERMVPVEPAKTVVERTAAEVAGEITTIAAPAKDATSLTLPTVEEGFTVAIKTSDNEGVIALDGTIVPPEDETTVALVLTVTRTSDSTTADTDSINVVVPAKTATP